MQDQFNENTKIFSSAKQQVNKEIKNGFKENANQNIQDMTKFG